MGSSLEPGSFEEPSFELWWSGEFLGIGVVGRPLLERLLLWGSLEVEVT